MLKSCVFCSNTIKRNFLKMKHNSKLKFINHPIKIYFCIFYPVLKLYYKWTSHLSLLRNIKHAIDLKFIATIVDIFKYLKQWQFELQRNRRQIEAFLFNPGLKNWHSLSKVCWFGLEMSIELLIFILKKMLKFDFW